LNRKYLFIVLALSALLLLETTVYALNYASPGAAPSVPNEQEEDKGCPEERCEPGDTYCYTDSRGGHQCTCQNGGRWGPEVDCKDFEQKCSQEGSGGQCKKEVYSP